jgi:hypothetical protein
VVGPRRVPSGTGGVHEKVSGPAEELRERTGGGVQEEGAREKGEKSRRMEKEFEVS